jgi:hypothetical protein
MLDDRYTIVQRKRGTFSCNVHGRGYHSRCPSLHHRHVRIRMCGSAAADDDVIVISSSTLPMLMVMMMMMMPMLLILLLLLLLLLLLFGDETHPQQVLRSTSF